MVKDEGREYGDSDVLDNEEEQADATGGDLTPSMSGTPSTAPMGRYGIGSRGYTACLPETRKLTSTELADIDLAERIPPAVVKAVYEPPKRTAYEFCRLVLALSCAALAMYWLFPWDRFFKRRPGEIKTSLTTAKITTEDVKKLGGEEKLTPLQKALFDITQARKAGDLQGVLARCEAEIARIDPKDWLKWEPVWDHYFHVLYQLRMDSKLAQEATRFLARVDRNVSSRFYQAKAFLRGFPRVSEDKKWRDRAVRAAALMADAALRLKTRLEESPSDDKGRPALENKLTEVAIVQAEAHERAWWAGGYEEEDPDVDDHRDRALTILKGLGNKRLALAIRKRILTDILDKWRWWWGDERYMGKEVDDSVVKKELKAVEKQLAEH
jgi:hypothetical protein